MKENQSNNDDFVEYMNNVKNACDNFSKAMVKYMYKNRYKILKELIEENNKLMGGDCRTKGMTK